jgi:hypothetical protein
MPLKIVTDNGPEFANQLMTELSLLLGIQHSKTSPYNSKANGKVENIHKTCQTMLRCFIKEYHKNWDLLIPLIEFALNTSKSEVTGHTPFFLHFGRHPIMPLDALYSAITRPAITVDQYVAQLADERATVLKWVFQKKLKMAEKYCDTYDKLHKNTITSLSVGDLVRKRNAQRKGPYGEKYNPLYSQELYTVLEDNGKGSYTIQDIQRRDPSVTYNIELLKRIPVRHEVYFESGEKDSLSMAKVNYEPEDDEDDTEDITEYPVKEILLHRTSKDGQSEYKIWFQGYHKRGAQWLPAENVSPEAIEAYKAKLMAQAAHKAEKPKPDNRRKRQRS